MIGSGLNMVVDIDAKVTELEKRLDEHLTACDKLIKQMLSKQDENSRLIEKLTTSVENLNTSTAEVVNSYNMVSSAIRALCKIGQFFKWLSGLGVFAYTASHWEAFIKIFNGS